MPHFRSHYKGRDKWKKRRDEVADELVVSKGEPGFTELERIFNAARRKARSADELLDSMLGQLAKA